MLLIAKNYCSRQGSRQRWKDQTDRKRQGRIDLVMGVEVKVQAHKTLTVIDTLKSERPKGL